MQFDGYGFAAIPPSPRTTRSRGSGPQGPATGPYGLSAGKDLHPTTARRASHGSLYLPGLPGFLAENMMTILAVDIGYSSLKLAYGDNRSDLSALILPSIAAPKRRIARVIGTEGGDEDLEVLVDGRTYVACCNPAHTRVERVVHEDYAQEDTYQALYRAALVMSGASELDYVITGLPVSQSQDPQRVASLKDMMSGRIEAKEGRFIDVKHVDVVPQPLGAYFELAAEWDGPKELLKGNIVVIDPGYYSVDWITMNAGRLMLESSGTSLNATSRIIEGAAEILRERNGGMVDPQTIEHALRQEKSHIVAFGRMLDVRQAVQEAAVDPVREALRAVRASVRQTRAEPGIVVVAGGGTEFYKAKVSEHFPGWRVWTGRTPVMSNVRGFWLYRHLRETRGRPATPT